VVRYGGFWQAVKFPWQILPLLNHLLQGLPKSQKRHSPSIHPTAVLEGNVVLSSGVKILPHASVIGPSFIGRDTVIGTGALVRQSSIGNLCVIGYNTEVKASILSHHVWTHSTYIGDSVMGENVAFGAGVVTGNFRLDEGEISSQWGGRTIPTGLQKFGAVIGEGSRIGIQVGTNPGVKIGKGSFVCGGAFVTEDVPDHSFVCSKYGAQCVRENRVQALQANKRVKFRRAAL
jgi:bifunctional UDP-N-acetylglucosamine pyrophosphorylase/glucosamine-1-phosphate N-acetyltransferase